MFIFSLYLIEFFFKIWIVFFYLTLYFFLVKRCNCKWISFKVCIKISHAVSRLERFSLHTTSQNSKQWIKSIYWLDLFNRGTILVYLSIIIKTILKKFCFFEMYINVILFLQLCGLARILCHDGNPFPWSAGRRAWCANDSSHQDCMWTFWVSVGHASIGIVCTILYHQHQNASSHTSPCTLQLPEILL